MATPTPVYHEDHYIERDSSSHAGTWLVVAAVIVLLAILLFGTNAFRGGNNGGNTNTGTGASGTVNTPSGSGSGSVNTQ